MKTNINKLEIYLYLQSCQFTKPLANSYQSKILNQLDTYAKAWVSRSGKLIIDRGENYNYIIKIDLYSKVQSSSGDQYYIYKNYLLPHVCGRVIAPLQMLEINGYYIYIQEKVNTYANIIDKPIINLEQKQDWITFFNKLKYVPSDKFLEWCCLASDYYGKYMLQYIYYILYIHKHMDLSIENVGFSIIDNRPLIIDF